MKWIRWLLNHNFGHVFCFMFLNITLKAVSKAQDCVSELIYNLRNFLFFSLAKYCYVFRQSLKLNFRWSPAYHLCCLWASQSTVKELLSIACLRYPAQILDGFSVIFSILTIFLQCNEGTIPWRRRNRLFHIRTHKNTRARTHTHTNTHARAGAWNTEWFENIL
jgi:hypothetical protein